MLSLAPDQPYDASVAAGTFLTGLTGTVGVQLLDGEGNVVVARTTSDIIEAPAGSSIYLADNLTTPTDEGQYLIVWDDAAGTFASEDLFVSERFLVPIGGAEGAYATVDELAALLRVNATSRADQLERVLAAAAFEIDQELGRGDPFVNPPALVVEVNLERAVEHWQQMQSPFGIIGLGAETGPAHVARDSWERHALKLAPLKQSWGFA